MTIRKIKVMIGPEKIKQIGISTEMHQTFYFLWHKTVNYVDIKKCEIRFSDRLAILFTSAMLLSFYIYTTLLSFIPKTYYSF